MRFTKRVLAQLPYCYATLELRAGGRTKWLFAPDDVGPCIAVDAQSGALQRVWDAPGGTMSMIPMIGREGEFLASQRFFPGFHAREAEILRFCYEAGNWRAFPWLKLPYVHRFDLIAQAGRNWFLGCILSGTARDAADWENPGRLIVAELDAAQNPPTCFQTIAEGMHRNHGYCRQKIGDDEWILTACDEGVFRLTPPGAHCAEWQVERLTGDPASDVAACDLDGDGRPELIVISPFHGAEVRIYHQSAAGYVQTAEIEHHSGFLHAIWAGKIAGARAALIGGRAEARETLLIRYRAGKYCSEVIEQGFGASNVFVSGDRILIANRESGECAVLTAEKNEA